jgi:hypothetical protein
MPLAAENSAGARSTALTRPKTIAQRGGRARSVQDVVASRVMPHPKDVVKRVATKAAACQCSRRGELGDYIDPADLMGSDDYAALAAMLQLDPNELGSWLSSAFKSITGTKISDVLAPVAGIVGGAIGGPAGAAIGSTVGGLLSGGGSTPQAPAGSVIASPMQAPMTQSPALDLPGLFNSIGNIFKNAQQAAIPRPSAPAPAPTVIQQSGFTMKPEYVAVAAIAAVGLVIALRK